MTIIISAILTFLLVCFISAFIKALFKKRIKAEDIVLIGGPAIVITFFIIITDISPILQICLLIIFLLGLQDDIWNLKPGFKLMIEILIAGFIVSNRATLQLTDYGFLNRLITIFWIVFMTNAFNLSDNMDSNLCSIIIFTFLGIMVFLNPDSFILSICLCLIGCMIGFSFFNWKPATVYLGDSGALFLGFLASYVSIIIANSYDSHRAIVPVFLLLVPFIDTVFVSIRRILNSRSIFHGGKDHLSHSLARLFNSETIAVLLLSFISFIGIINVWINIMSCYILTGLVLTGMMIVLYKIEREYN